VQKALAQADLLPEFERAILRAGLRRSNAPEG
jgi:hypothetical protein